MSLRFVGLCLVFGGIALAADPPGFPPGKTFTFKSATATLGAVLDELTKQTNVEIDRSEAENDRAMKIDCEKMPFWDALERIARESDHRIAFSEGGQKLQLRGGGEIVYRETPMSVDRVFRVSARRMQATANFEDDRSYVDVQLNLNWEPGISVFLVDQPGRSATAKDSADQDIRVTDDGGGRIPASGNGVEMTLRLTGVTRAARSIKLLEGKVGVIGAAGTLEFKFPKPVQTAEPRSEKQGDVTVGLRTDFKAGSDLWTARVEFEYPAGGPALESYESAAWLIENKAWLAGVDGKSRIDNNGGYEVISQGDRKAIVIYRFTDDAGQKLGKPEDWTFHVRTPTRLLTTDVRFRLENIPLP
ncbi:MAG: hypothetical protein K1X57_17760 [Gemmataceae bacterium]|nr:hypothetical protein [Gemmataceae bacterium]